MVAVVRCCECKYYENPRLKVFENCCRKDLLIPMKPNDYCSYGIKMEKEEIEDKNTLDDLGNNWY